MYTLNTPKELIVKLSTLIERERKVQGFKQSELSKMAAIPLPTYKQFVYKHKISLENVFKLLFALKMGENIEGLLYEHNHRSLEEMKNKESLPKRIR